MGMWLQTWTFVGIDVRTLQALSNANDGCESRWLSKDDQLVGQIFVRELTPFIGGKTSPTIPHYIGLMRDHHSIKEFFAWPGTHVDG